MLKGIRILDFSHYIPGPYASMRLADLGAEVIKVEPLSGDPGRHIGGTQAEQGLVHEANNRNKKSLTVNLKTNEGLELLSELLKKSDVVIESFRPGVMNRLGLGYEDVKGMNKSIVYCSLSGFGQQGILSKLGSHDINYMAISGILAQLKDQNGRPIHPTITLADLIGGLAASEKILASLIQQQRTGEGQYIDAALADTMISLMNTHIAVERKTGKQNGLSVLTGDLISYSIYETKDQRYVSIGALESKFWNNFCHALNKQEWIPHHYSKTEDKNPMFIEIKKMFRSKTLEEWTQFSIEVDCCIAPILEVGELPDHPYISERNLIYKVSPELLQVSTTLQQSQAFTPPPKKGSHTKVILTELLNKTEDEVHLLKKKGVI